MVTKPELSVSWRARFIPEMTLPSVEIGITLSRDLPHVFQKLHDATLRAHLRRATTNAFYTAVKEASRELGDFVAMAPSIVTVRIPGQSKIIDASLARYRIKPVLGALVSGGLLPMRLEYWYPWTDLIQDQSMKEWAVVTVKGATHEDIESRSEMFSEKSHVTADKNDDEWAMVAENASLIETRGDNRSNRMRFEKLRKIVSSALIQRTPDKEEDGATVTFVHSYPKDQPVAWTRGEMVGMGWRVLKELKRCGHFKTVKMKNSLWKYRVVRSDKPWFAIRLSNKVIVRSYMDYAYEE